MGDDCPVEFSCVIVNSVNKLIRFLAYLSLVSITQQMPRSQHKNKTILRLSSHLSHQSLCFDSKLVYVVNIIDLMATML